jgi:hypothetical protein
VTQRTLGGGERVGDGALEIRTVLLLSACTCQLCKGTRRGQELLGRCNEAATASVSAALQAIMGAASFSGLLVLGEVPKNFSHFCSHLPHCCSLGSILPSPLVSPGPCLRPMSFSSICPCFVELALRNAVKNL